MASDLAVAYAADPLRDSRHRSAAAARDLVDWLAYLELGNKAERTLDGYERIVASLLRAFPHKEMGEFTDGDVSYIVRRTPKPSRHISKSILNRWFVWGVKTRRIQHNPVDLLPEITYRPNRAYNLFTDAEADALCALPSPDGPLCALLFWAGLRRSEAIGLTGKRIDFERLQVVVIDGAKRDRQRRVPMVGPLSEALSGLMLTDAIGPDHFFWYTRNGRRGQPRRDHPVAFQTFNNWWNRCIKTAAVPYRNPHMARHTCATRLHRNGVPLEDVQLILGHESYRTTRDTYVHSNIDQIGERLREVFG